MIAEQKYQSIEAIADMYQLLSVSLHLPNIEFVEALLDGRIAADVVDILIELEYPEKFVRDITRKLDELKSFDGNADVLLAELKQEYTRLFTHPMQPEIKIYETSFLDPGKNKKEKSPLFISPAALSAERHYKNAGLHMAGNMHEPPDHFATELEFMMFLYQQKARSFSQNDLDECDVWQKRIDEFNKEHIEKWAVTFFSQCKISARMSFYNMIGEIGIQFIGRMLA